MIAIIAKITDLSLMTAIQSSLNQHCLPKQKTSSFSQIFAQKELGGSS
jgi:type III secretory pathway lipoprotein EscJ